MSDTAQQRSEDASRGTSLLPGDLTPAQLKAAQVLASVDSLIIDDVTDKDFDAFVSALRS